MKAIIAIILLLLMASKALAADAPKSVVSEIDKLAGLNSALNDCLSSSEGKRLNSTQWLEIEKKSMEIDEFVVLTGNYFNDKFLFTAYKLAGDRYTSEGKVKSNVLTRYKRLCSLEMQRDIMTEVDAVEKNINTLKTRRN